MAGVQPLAEGAAFARFSLQKPRQVQIFNFQNHVLERFFWFFSTELSRCVKPEEQPEKLVSCKENYENLINFNFLNFKSEKKEESS